MYSRLLLFNFCNDYNCACFICLYLCTDFIVQIQFWCRCLVLILWIALLYLLTNSCRLCCRFPMDFSVSFVCPILKLVFVMELWNHVHVKFSTSALEWVGFPLVLMLELNCLLLLPHSIIPSRSLRSEIVSTSFLKLLPVFIICTFLIACRKCYLYRWGGM